MESGATGAVFGYVGAEAATSAVFTPCLWPQRFRTGLRWSDVPKLILLAPAGGPLYHEALRVLDSMYIAGLFRGRERGHMLGTCFFPTSGSSCSAVLGHSDTNVVWNRLGRHCEAGHHISREGSRSAASYEPSHQKEEVASRCLGY